MEDESLLEAIYQDESFDFQDVDMDDVEDEQNQFQDENSEVGREDDKSLHEKTQDVNMLSRKRRRRKAKKKKKKVHNGSVVDHNIDINRFVLGTCKRLNEKKIHLVRESVDYLGVEAVRDLVAEVETIQKCGGQLTVDGNRPRTGGGILWNILKSRDRKAYKEIMARGKRFMQQRKKEQEALKLPNEHIQQKIAPHLPVAETKENLDSASAGILQSGLSPKGSSHNRASVWQRVRVPVSYDDLVGDDTEEGEITE